MKPGVARLVFRTKEGGEKLRKKKEAMIMKAIKGDAEP